MTKLKTEDQSVGCESAGRSGAITLKKLRLVLKKGPNRTRGGGDLHVQEEEEEESKEEEEKEELNEMKRE